jgi:hypothetical protein
MRYGVRVPSTLGGGIVMRVIYAGRAGNANMTRRNERTAEANLQTGLLAREEE